MEKMGKLIRPPKVRSFTVFAVGPRLLGLERQPHRFGGPGPPPPGFVGPTTSLSEWIVYWAIARALNDPTPEHVRNPPFFGGRDWAYQSGVEGGRRIRGGSVVDYIVYLPGEQVGIRLQTWRFHEAAGPKKQAYDVVQAEQLSRFMVVKDLYEQDIGLNDPSGATAVRAVVDLLGGRFRMSPINTHRARQERA
jgi:hypothetical protein